MRFSSLTRPPKVSVEQLFQASARFPACCGRRTALSATRPLILLGHGGGRHKKDPGHHWSSPTAS